MARGSHHSSGGHHGSHHSSSHRSSGGSRSHSYRSHSYGRHYHSSSGTVMLQSSEPPEGVKSYNGTWISGSRFNLNMEDPVVQEKAKNKKIYNEVKMYGILGVAWLICMYIFGTNVFYEMVIPVFENMSMNDVTFMLFDDMVYYAPLLILFALFVVMCGLISKSKENKRALCKEIVDYYSQKEYEHKVELETQEKINNLELYSECPNCGASATFGSLKCIYCGSSLVKEE